jgi:hypothetical protein
MRLILSPDGFLLEVYDVTECEHCGTSLRFAGRTWLQCSCAGTNGHRMFWCADCRRFSYDPPHRRDVPDPSRT